MGEDPTCRFALSIFASKIFRARFQTLWPLLSPSVENRSALIGTAHEPCQAHELLLGLFCSSGVPYKPQPPCPLQLFKV